MPPPSLPPPLSQSKQTGQENKTMARPFTCSKGVSRKQNRNDDASDCLTTISFQKKKTTPLTKSNVHSKM